MKLSLPHERLVYPHKTWDAHPHISSPNAPLNSANSDTAMTTRFLKWTVFLSIVGLLLNISVWVEMPTPERLSAIFVTLILSPVSAWAYTQAKKGNILRALQIETVGLAIVGGYNSWMIPYAGLVVMFFPLLLFVSLMTQLNRRAVRWLAVVNLLVSLFNAGLAVWSLSQGRSITPLQGFNIIVGMSVLMVFVFMRLSFYQTYMNTVVSELSANNHRLLVLEQELTAKSALLADRNVALEALRDSALQSSEMKSQFVSTVSHELRTPLHGIQGYLELMQETTLDDEQRDYINTAYESSIALNEIINEVLDFARIERGAIDIVYEPVNVHQLLIGVIETLGIKARQKGLQVSYSIAPNVPSTLMLDKQRVRQILINLMGNAIKFTASGGVNVAVQVPDAISEQLFISVTDTGLGIPPALIGRLFQPFVQNTEAGHSHVGTGLGLSIVKRLVELMGGQVGVESKWGEGARFWFTLSAPLSQPTP